MYMCISYFKGIENLDLKSVKKAFFQDYRSSKNIEQLGG